MALNARDGAETPRSVGIEATSLERYSAVETDGAGLIVYDEEDDDAWIQSDVWTAAETNT